MKQSYQPELNFIFEYPLSRNGMVQELTTELNVLRFGLSNIQEIGQDYSDVIDRVILVPLRKLLCENQSVIKLLCPDFKMMPIKGRLIDLEDKLKLYITPFDFVKVDEWITIDDWISQKIAYYDKQATDCQRSIDENTFLQIVNRIKKKQDKLDFQNLYKKETISYKGENVVVYSLVDDNSETVNSAFNTLKQTGYYDLTVYDFIKHLADKRGAHLDTSASVFIETINKPDQNQLNAIRCWALQLIFAVKEQIPEFADYWPEASTPY